MSTTTGGNGHETPIGDALAGAQRLAIDPAGNGEVRPGGWTKINNAIIERIGDLGLAPFAVYAVLCRHADRAGTCFPSANRIGGYTGLAVRTVRRAIRRLVDKGLVRVEARRTDKGTSLTNLYYLMPPINQGDTKDGVGGRLCQGEGGVCVTPEGDTNDPGRVTQTTPEVDPIEQDPKNKTQGRKKPAKAGDLPPALRELITLWNGLGPSIVKSGNGAELNPPAKAVVSGWTRAQKDPDQREALADLPKLLETIRGAKFCHGQGWFSLPWIFGRNKAGEFTVCRLLAGAYSQEQSNGRNTMPLGPGQRHPDDAKPGRWG